MSYKTTNIVVVGQGAMGLLWYHHLSKTQTDRNTSVSLLASNNLLSRQNATNNSASIPTNNANSDTHEYHFTPYKQEQSQSYPLTYTQVTDIEKADILLLCVKSYQVASAIKKIVNILPVRCLIILANNGMGVFEEVVNLVSNKQRILAMLTTHGCLRSSPFNIIHTGLGESDIGLLSGWKSRKGVNEESDFRLNDINEFQDALLTKLLHHALPKVTFHINIHYKQWLKLAINCVINPITAINNIDNGEVNNEKFSQLINLLLTEVIDVANAELSELELNNLGENRLLNDELNSEKLGCASFNKTDLKKLVANVAQATDKNCSSMRSDVLAGRKTEIDYINGYIHRIGQKHHIATPENTRLWQTVKSFNKS